MGKHAMPTDTISTGCLSAEIRAAIEAMSRRTGYLGPSIHQLERWAAEAARLEASHTDKPEVHDALEQWGQAVRAKESDHG